jgi:hypothetical protein
MQAERKTVNVTKTVEVEQVVKVLRNVEVQENVVVLQLTREEAQLLRDFLGWKIALCPVTSNEFRESVFGSKLYKTLEPFTELNSPATLERLNSI